MYIHEAIQKASEHNLGIQRKEWKKTGMALIPTDSAYLGMFIVANNGKEGSRNWNPMATDLIANDWELF